MKILPISPLKASEIEKEEHKMLFRYPKDFRSDDEELIKKFSERLREIRKKREYQAKHPEEPNDSLVKDRKNWTQASVAEDLGVSSMSLSKYENGHITNIPLRHFIRLTEIFDVTSHYLLGYVDNEHTVLELDDKDNIVKDENGKPKELLHGFVTMPVIKQQKVEDYSNLVYEDNNLFELISKLIRAPRKKREVCVEVLRALLNNQ